MMTIILLSVSFIAVLLGIIFTIDARKHETEKGKAVMPLFMMGWGFFALKILSELFYEISGYTFLDDAFSVIYSTLVMLFFVAGMYLLTKDFSDGKAKLENRKA